jgi:thioredoxin-related protein
MMRILWLLMVLVGQSASSWAQTLEEPSPIKWYSLEQAQELAAKQPRPFLVDVYTDWCGWCKHMMRTTFANPGLATYIQNNFYPVRYDAETTDTIVYKGKSYVNSDYLRDEALRIEAEKKGVPFTASRSKYTHDLAKEILQGRLSYPTLVYVDMQGKENPVPGYMDVPKIEPLLVYFAEDINRLVGFDEFERLYQFSFPEAYKEAIEKYKPEDKPDTLGVVKWLSFEEAKAASAKHPRKFFVDMHVSWRIGCRVMQEAVYTDSGVAKVLNEQYYPIRFDGMSKDSVSFMGAKFINEGKQHPFHQLAVQFAVQGGRILFPTVVFFDDKMKPITKVQEFLPPDKAAAFLEFIASDGYKTRKWAEFFEEWLKKR